MRLAAWRAGFEAGRQAEAAERDAAWIRIARPLARGGPSYAELDRKRYPPDGRAGWLLPEPSAADQWLDYLSGGER